MTGRPRAPKYFANRLECPPLQSLKAELPVPNFLSFAARTVRGTGAAAALLALLSLLSSPGAAARPAAPAASEQPTDEQTAAQLRDTALAGESLAWDWVSELTTRFGPRPAGSENEHQAAEWAMERMKALGFSNVHIESFPVTAWVRGLESGQIVGPVNQPLAVAALGESPPTPATGLEGDVVIFPTFADLKAAPANSLTGRIAFVAQHMVRTQDGAGYGVAVEARTDGPAQAARRGAIAFVLRSVGTDSNRLPHTGTTVYVDGKVPVPAFALAAADADQLERLAALGGKVRIRLYSTAATMRDAHSQNVIADVPGRVHPEEFVLLGAHLDSWDQGTGAIDDGTGTAIVTAAAKLILDLPHHPPRRTVRVVLFGSEEVAQPAAPFGAFGGHSYADNHKAELARHMLAGESDFGTDRVYALALPAAAARSDLATTAMRVLAPIGVLPAADPVSHAGTDVGPAIEAGVPAFALLQDGSQYFDFHHTANDTLDKVDREQLDQNVAAWAALVWLAADSEVDFRGHEAPH
ncbi:MAG: M28 family peptidase [Gammaproteobacteria bacterium]|nr:M28 family peptidase [Gammaproteobacteria bacterium]